VKRFFRKIKKVVEKIDKLRTVGSYKISLKYIPNQKDPALQDGRRFFYRRNRHGTRSD
jgi:hypothetical protein